jgi:hypothetical protein
MTSLYRPELEKRAFNPMIQFGLSFRTIKTNFKLRQPEYLKDLRKLTTSHYRINISLAIRIIGGPLDLTKRLARYAAEPATADYLKGKNPME